MPARVGFDCRTSAYGGRLSHEVRSIRATALAGARGGYRVRYGTYDVNPEAVRQVLSDVQAQAVEFGQLTGEAATEMMELSEACKAPPITAELNSLYRYVMRRAINIADGRTANAVNAVSQAVNALAQGDDQMSESARNAAAQAAQEHADDAPGAADNPRNTGRGPAQAF